MRKTANGWKWGIETSTEYPVLSTQLGESNGGGVSTSGERKRIPRFARKDKRAAETDRVVIPWMFAVADPQEKWWLRLRGNPKRSGEISQAAFLLKAEMLGFHLALPWGDSERYDFVVWGRGGNAIRVQVKGTGRLHRGGYEVQPVHTTRQGRKKRYTKRDIDVIAAHVQPEDAWYLIPIEKIGRAKSLRLYPGLEKPRRVKRPKRDWERWMGAWDVLG